MLIANCAKCFVFLNECIHLWSQVEIYSFMREWGAWCHRSDRERLTKSLLCWKFFNHIFTFSLWFLYFFSAHLYLWTGCSVENRWHEQSRLSLFLATIKVGQLAPCRGMLCQETRHRLCKGGLPPLSVALTQLPIRVKALWIFPFFTLWMWHLEPDIMVLKSSQ